MVKTPEEYFADLSFAPPEQGTAASLSDAERAFVQKYLGGETVAALPVQSPLAAMPCTGTEQIRAPAEMPSAPAAATAGQYRHDAAAAPKAAVPLKSHLAAQDKVQMVSFYVREQIFLLPVCVIVEVLRYMPLTRLPMAPPFVAGVVNLRGRVTPLLHLDALLTLEQQYHYAPGNFIVVCNGKDMQLGFIVDKIHTMYMIDQRKINWNAENQLGASADFLYGLAEVGDHLHGIIDPEVIVEKLLDI
ncbi:chemotaxis protein CheW [Desulfovibrio sp.]|uniref:chemotaxis protein CheW n=1 Tax=Desulfovibrio sp. TaxID=885 RepID=UPI0025C0F599|nr:chemotaxis protein CheW [Desulfovibrio sp.]